MQLELPRESHFIGEQKFNVIIVICVKFWFKKVPIWEISGKTDKI